MGRPLEVEAWAAGGGYRVTVYREAEGGAGYRKIKDYGEESRKWCRNPVDEEDGVRGDVGERRRAERR